MNLLHDCIGINEAGHMTLGGADVVSLAEQFGTPLYLMDEGEILRSCRDFTRTIREAYAGDSLIAYASKAFACAHMYRLLQNEGMGADVVSGGELYTALKGGLDPARIYFHGNNKTDAELRYALDSGLRCIVVDNFEELRRLSAIAGGAGKTADIAFRLKPGVGVHTHDFVSTGQIDSKFGVAIETGEALAIVKEALGLPGVRVIGVHCHIGSQIFEAEPFKLAVRILMDFVKDVKASLGHELSELNLGGGFGIRYLPGQDPRAVPVVVRAAAEAVTAVASELGLPLPRLILEPGRSIVGAAGITVYRVGSVKVIPGVRTYVSVDGGLADNPRPAMYSAVYTAVPPENPAAEATEVVTISGRCCESDTLAKDIAVPPVKAGDLLAFLSTGAYNYSMASHYNRLPNPPVVMIRGGKPFVAVAREKWEDMARNDILSAE